MFCDLNFWDRKETLQVRAKLEEMETTFRATGNSFAHKRFFLLLNRFEDLLVRTTLDRGDCDTMRRGESISRACRRISRAALVPQAKYFD